MLRRVAALWLLGLFNWGLAVGNLQLFILSFRHRNFGVSWGGLLTGGKVGVEGRDLQILLRVTKEIRQRVQNVVVVLEKLLEAGAELLNRGFFVYVRQSVVRVGLVHFGRNSALHKLIEVLHQSLLAVGLRRGHYAGWALTRWRWTKLSGASSIKILLRIWLLSTSRKILRSGP